jgi:hypothetical protein
MEGREAPHEQGQPQVIGSEVHHEYDHYLLFDTGKEALRVQGHHHHLLLVKTEALHEQEPPDTTQMIAMNTVGGEEVTASQDLIHYLILSHPYRPHLLALRRILQAVRV